MWHISAASRSLFNTSVSFVMGCRGNVSYNRFTFSSMCSTNFSTQSLPQYIFKGQEHLHRQGCCVHTILMVHVCLPFPYMMPCLFSQSSLYSSCSCTVHWLVSKYFQSLHTYKWNLKLILSIREILTIFLFQWASWHWRDHCCCSTHDAYPLLTLSENR